MNMTRPIWSAFILESVAESRRGKTEGLQHGLWNLAFMGGSAMGGHMLGWFGGWVFPLAASMYFFVALFAMVDLRRARQVFEIEAREAGTYPVIGPESPSY